MPEVLTAEFRPPRNGEMDSQKYRNNTTNPAAPPASNCTSMLPEPGSKYPKTVSMTPLSLVKNAGPHFANQFVSILFRWTPQNIVSGILCRN
jgi:hypothetical protein